MNNISPEALAEVREILKYSSIDIQKKLPYKLRKYIVKNYDKQYKLDLDFRKKLCEQNIKLETKKVLALIYRDYIVDEEKREQLIENETKRNKKTIHAIQIKNNLFKEKSIKKEHKQMIRVDNKNKIHNFLEFLRKIFFK